MGTITAGEAVERLKFNNVNNQVSFHTEKEIEEKGGEDKEELKDLLEEVKELCENIQVNNPLPKRKKLLDRLSNHMAKHDWFYGEIVGLIGSAAMTAMME